MRKFFKITVWVVAILLAALMIVYFNWNEKLPHGNTGAEADRVAEKMMAAVNKEAWDTTRYVTWTFRGAHHYLWDKKEHRVLVQWDENEVILYPETITGKVKTSGTNLSGEEAQSLVKTAWDYFNNDSFWLNPIIKAFDPGTERSLVVLEDGRKGLKVHYASGGSTPGDSYVWILDENGLPAVCKMWVSIIPIGGMTFSWEGWMELSTGAKVATFHQNRLLNITLDNVKGGQDLSEIGLKNNPFESF